MAVTQRDARLGKQRPEPDLESPGSQGGGPEGRGTRGKLGQLEPGGEEEAEGAAEVQSGFRRPWVPGGLGHILL